MQPPTLAAVIPLKSLGTAKGRLAGTLAPDDRRSLVLSMFDHVATTAMKATSIDRVVVVTASRAAARRARGHGLQVVDDPGGGLNAAVMAADALLAPDAVLAHDGATLVLAADLPEVTAAEIDHVASLAGSGPGVVVASTHDGGTGALLRRPGRVIAPRYGAGSAAAHLAAGAAAGVRTAHLRLPGLTYDVDHPSDLARVGLLAPEMSGRVWSQGREPGAALDSPPRATATLTSRQEPTMPQGTIKSFDPESGAGTVVTDDQRELRFDTETFMASGLEELRLGQRVRFEIEDRDGDRRVRALNLVSF